MRRFVLAGIAAASLGMLWPSAAPARIPGPTVSLGKSKGLEYMRARFEQVVSQAAQPANCDGDSTVTGGGGSISGPTINAALNESYPVKPNGFTWQAEGSAGTSRTLTAYAVCGPAEVSYESYQTPLGSNAGLAALVPCPAQRDPISGGISATGPGILIDASRAALGPGTVGWDNLAENPTVDDTLVDAYAVCGQAYDVRYRSAAADAKTAPGEAGKAVAQCKPKEAVLGGGFASTRQGIQQFDAWVIATRPWDSKEDRNKTPDDGWSVRAHNGTGFPVKVQALAVCQHELPE